MLDETDFDYIPTEIQKQDKRTLEIPTDVINDSDSIALELETGATEGKIVLGKNSRCVSVDTISSAPEGRREKRVFKGKEELVKFRCSVYEKKLLKVKAKNTGLTLSEYIRRSVFEKEITERFSEEHINIYKMLIKYHNNFKSIGNMFKKRDPKLTQKVHELANEIKGHLNNFQK